MSGVVRFHEDFLVVAAGTLLKAFLTFALNKVTALGLGSGSFSRYGQYYVVLTFLYTAASLGLSNAHTVYVASSRNSELATGGGHVSHKQVACHIAVLGGASVGFIAFGSLLFGGGRADFLPEFPFLLSILILLYCIAAPLGVAVMAVCVAEQRYRRQQAISIGISATSTLLMTCLWLFEWMRPETAAAVYCIGFFLPVLFLRNLSIRPAAIRRADFAAAFHFYRPFVLPGITGSLVASTATMSVLGMVRVGGAEEMAGAWFGVWRLSEAYNGLVLAVATALYLPRMARAGKQLGREIIFSFFLMVLLYSPLMILLLFFPQWTIALFFSQDFSTNLPSLWPQVAGDLLKLFCAVHILALSAIAAPKWILVAEIVFATVFVSGTAVVVSDYGFSGVLLSYAGSYFLLAVLLIFVLWRLMIEIYQ